MAAAELDNQPPAQRPPLDSARQLTGGPTVLWIGKLDSPHESPAAHITHPWVVPEFVEGSGNLRAAPLHVAQHVVSVEDLDHFHPRRKSQLVAAEGASVCARSPDIQALIVDDDRNWSADPAQR